MQVHHEKLVNHKAKYCTFPETGYDRRPNSPHEKQLTSSHVIKQLACILRFIRENIREYLAIKLKKNSDFTQEESYLL